MAKRLKAVYLHPKKERKSKLDSDDYPWFDPHLILIKNINGYRIEIYSKTDFEFQGHRHSYVVRKPGIGIYASGGYVENNEIVFPTVESALVDSIKYVGNGEQEIKRIKREVLVSRKGSKETTEIIIKNY